MAHKLTLAVEDYGQMVKLIDACVERGAFKGNEIFFVGGLRERIEKLRTDLTADQPELLAETTETEPKK